jgi:hypothetical protein
MAEILLLATTARLALGLVHSSVKCVPGAVSPWLKRSEHEVDHSSPRCSIKQGTILTLLLTFNFSFTSLSFNKYPQAEFTVQKVS